MGTRTSIKEKVDVTVGAVCEHEVQDVVFEHGWFHCRGCGEAYPTLDAAKSSVVKNMAAARRKAAVLNVVWEAHVADALAVASPREET